MESKFRQGKRSTCEIIPYRNFHANNSQGLDRSFYIKKCMPNGLEQWFDLHESCIYRTIEVGQELVYEMYQTEIQGNDWVRYGLAPMTITQIVRS
jgi:hypothetical protein